MQTLEGRDRCKANIEGMGGLLMKAASRLNMHARGKRAPTLTRRLSYLGIYSLSCSRLESWTLRGCQNAGRTCAKAAVVVVWQGQDHITGVLKAMMVALPQHTPRSLKEGSSHHPYNMCVMLLSFAIDVNATLCSSKFSNCAWQGSLALDVASTTQF